MFVSPHFPRGVGTRLWVLPRAPSCLKLCASEGREGFWSLFCRVGSLHTTPGCREDLARGRAGVFVGPTPPPPCAPHSLLSEARRGCPGHVWELGREGEKTAAPAEEAVNEPFE